MSEPGRDEKQNATPNSDRQRIPGWLRLLVITLLLLVLLSFVVIVFLIGQTGSYEGYTGRIIDTITLGAKKNGTAVDQLEIHIRGRVLYSDGTPYQNGMVVMEGNQGFTVYTDAEGRFEFAGVIPGEHTIRVFQDNRVVATSNVRVQREELINTAQIVKLDDQTYFIMTPLDLPAIDLLVNIEQGMGTGQAPGGSGENTGNNSVAGANGNNSNGSMTVTLDNPRPPSLPPVAPPVAPPVVPSSIQPPAPSLPGTISGAPIAAVDPSSSQSPSSSLPPADDPDDAPDDPADEAPLFVAADERDPTRFWTSLSAVDLFAEREGNHGVQTILGNNVIAPGSYGSFVFRVYNPESLPLEYTINLLETDQNNPALPMVYRLKRGNGGTDYINGSDWKPADNIALTATTIPPKTAAVYTLDWKWNTVSDAVDTAIATQSTRPMYILNIVITAEYK